MFVITNLMVEDKALAKLLTAMAGLVVSMDVPRPVVNAIIHKGKVKQAAEGGSMWEVVGGTLKSQYSKGAMITPQIIKKAVVEAGGSEDSYSYFTQAMVKEGLIHKTKDRGVYTMT